MSCTPQILDIAIVEVGEGKPPLRVWKCKISFTNSSDTERWLLIPEYLDTRVERQSEVDVLRFEVFDKGACIHAFSIEGKCAFYAFPVPSNSHLLIERQPFRAFGKSGVARLQIARSIELVDRGFIMECLPVEDRGKWDSRLLGKSLHIDAPEYDRCVAEYRRVNGKGLHLVIDATDFQEIVLDDPAK